MVSMSGLRSLVDDLRPLWQAGRLTVGTRRAKGLAAGVVVAAAMALTGCGSGSTSTSGAAVSPTVVGRYGAAGSSGAAGSASPGATMVTVAETEFSITLPHKTLNVGAYTFQVSNQGKFPHNLTIEGPGVDRAATPRLQPGQSGALTVTLTTGTYELWCSVDSHKDQGMDLTITVT
jgi:uncharacterized cupredoxin-like copper-binding protein